jgi:uncharacterized protein (TIGR00106 family)
MLVELSVIPVGTDKSLSDEIAKVLKVVDASGLPYRFTPAGTCIEGDWDEVMALVKQCHDRIRQESSHVITVVKIEDEAGATNKLVDNITSVEKKVGKSLKT